MLRRIALFVVFLIAALSCRADDFTLGRPGAKHPWLYDFNFDGTLNLTRSRGLYIFDIGDPPDLAMGRAGPNGALFGSYPQPTEPGSNLGAMYWMSCGVPEDQAALSMIAPGRTCEFNIGEHLPVPQPGDPPGALRQRPARNAQIYPRNVGVQTATNRAGELHFAVTPVGSHMPEDAFEIRSNRLLRIYHPGLNCLVDVQFGNPGSCGGGLRCLAVADTCAE